MAGTVAARSATGPAERSSDTEGDFEGRSTVTGGGWWHERTMMSRRILKLGLFPTALSKRRLILASEPDCRDDAMASARRDENGNWTIAAEDGDIAPTGANRWDNPITGSGTGHGLV